MNADQYARNVRAHCGLDRLDFAHKLVNQIVFRKAQHHRSSEIMKSSRPPRMADIGCGTGYLLSQFLRLGWDAVGLDPFPRGDSLREPLRGHVIQGTVAALGSDRFDLLTAVEVIEHVEDYLLLLQEMRRILVPGGMLIITVPNNWDFHTVTTEQGRKEPKYGHLWKFDPKGLQQDLEALFANVGVESIYSRWLDYRTFRILRQFPLSVIINFSSWLIRHRENGAWLMAWGTRTTQRQQPARLLSKPSAVHYANGCRAAN